MEQAILSAHEGHFLHEIIDVDESFHPVIDFDLPKDILNTITSKLSDNQIKNTFCNAFRDVCPKIFPEWDKKL